MTRWEHVQDVFHAALDKDSGERAVFIARECSGDSALRREVEALLISHRTAHEAFLESPRADEVARLLDHMPAREQRLVGRRIGSYQVTRVIGAGGMGTVYEAEQESPHRTIALKVMKGGVPSRSALRRFVDEAQILARLKHPGLAQVYEAGAFDDNGVSVPYFAMEFLAHAGTIIEAAAARRLTVDERLELFASVCDAVHHAHIKGIIHRDLKPANILVVDEAGDGSEPACRAKVIDFGVARVTDGDVALTTLGSDARLMIGTLQYMSPEQCAGEPGSLDVRSDVYALGVVLFELLSGRLPYDLENKSIPESARVIAQQEPSRLSAIDRRFRGDLDTIVAKSLEKDPERRYASAAALAADVRRHLHDEPILARPSSMLYQLGKFARRNKGVVAGCIGVLLTLIIGLAASTALYLRAEKARDDAVFREYIADIAAASAAIRANDVADARKRLDQAPAELRNFEWYHLHRCLDRSVMTLTGHTSVANCLALSPDGAILVSGGADHMLCLWDAVSGAPLCPPVNAHQGVITSVVFSRDGTRLLSAAADNIIKLWDVSSLPPTMIREYKGHDDHVYRAVFTPDETRIVSCGKDKTIRVWDLANATILKTLTQHTDRVHAVVFAPDGRIFASSSWDGTVKLWDPESYEELDTLRGHAGPVYGIAFSPDGSRLASASFDHTVRVWDVASRQTVLTLRGHTDVVYAVAVFSADGTRIATGSVDRTLRLWNAQSGEEITRLLGHAQDLRAVLFAQGDRRVMSCSSDHTIKFWDTATDPVPTVRGHQAWVYDAALSPDGSLLATAGSGRFPSGEVTIRLWDAATLAQRGELRGHEGLAFSVAFSPDGKRLASGSADRTLRLWNVETAEPIAVLTGHEGSVRRVAFSPDGTLLASASADGSVGLWNLASLPRAPRAAPEGSAPPTMQAILRKSGPRSVILSLAWFPDGQRLAAGSEDGAVTIWNALPGQESARISGHSSGVTALTIDGRGRWIASGATDSTIIIHDAATLAPLAHLTGHSARINDLAFSPDGTRLASACDDYTVKLWDTTTWREVATLHGHTNIVWSVQFSADGRTLASGSADLTARLWDAPANDSH